MKTDELLDELLEGGFWHTATPTWVPQLDLLLDGAVLTHRLSAEDLAHGVVHIAPIWQRSIRTSTS